MKVLLFSQNFYPELTGVGKYSFQLSQWMVSRGHHIDVICSQPYYPEWKLKSEKNIFEKEQFDGISIFRVPIYIPKRINIITRILHLLSFAILSIRTIFSRQKFEYDVIIYIVPSLLSFSTIWLFKRLTGAPCLMHIQDFELNAMKSISSNRWMNSKVIKIIRFFEKFIYDHVDLISTISVGMERELLRKGVEKNKIRLVPNWADKEFLSEDYRNEGLGLSEEKQPTAPRRASRQVLYCGNVGEKQDLETVLGAAEILLNKSDIHFLISGDGAAKLRLEKMAAVKGLCNVKFQPVQPHAEFGALLRTADVHLVTQKKGVGDAVLPSKLLNILAVGGNAVVSSEVGTALHDIGSESGAFEVIQPGDAQALADAILYGCELPRFNKAASKYAREHLDKDRILTGLVSCLDGLIRQD